jgi:hypothetical protein
VVPLAALRVPSSDLDGRPRGLARPAITDAIDDAITDATESIPPSVSRVSHCRRAVVARSRFVSFRFVSSSRAGSISHGRNDES